MAGKQEYNQVCPIASALDLVGSRWALLVVRELSLGPRRFGDIHIGLETASTDMLTSRLRELEAAGLVDRTDDRRYMLTSAGFALSPVMRSMLVWSLRIGALEGDGADGSPRSFGPDPVRRVLGLLGLMARTTALDAVDVAVELRVDQLTATVAKGLVGYEISEGVPAVADGTITMTGEVLLHVVVSGGPVEPLLSAGRIVVDNPTAKSVLLGLGRAVAAVHFEIDRPMA